MTRNRALAIVVAVICTLLPLAGAFYGDRASGWLGVDFHAYYCAASAAAHRVDPYFTASLHACESTRSPYFRATAVVAVPAPYPPYVFLLLYPLTLLPFGAALAVWWAFLAFCSGCAAYMLARITRRPLLIAWAVLVLSLVLASLASGNMVIVGITAILIAAYCVQQGYFLAAALALALSFVEPQFALPAALAASIRFPRVRPIVVLLLAALFAASLAQSGLRLNFEYLIAVLPAHALAEVSRDNQYSLSTVLAALGVPDAQAVLFGSISYAVAGAAGILAGLHLARHHHDPAFAVLVPPAFVVLGGNFVHTGELAAAVPACLLLYTRSESRGSLLLAATLLLAVPWMLASSITVLLAPLFPIAFLVYALAGHDRTRALASALAALALLATLFLLFQQHVPLVAARAAAHPPIDPRLAEAGWRTLVLGNTTNRLIMWLLRVPSWIGLIAFAVAALSPVRDTMRPLRVLRS